MLVGIDPFSDDDPMKTYQKILKGKINFPKTIDKDAKSLIKHLLTQDTSKRFGCLKNGVKDILNHRFFIGFDWKSFVFLKMPAPYIPPIKSDADTSNFEQYPDSDIESPSVDVRYSVGNLLGIVVLGYVLGSMLSAAVTQTTIL